jgi:hypothetical protein
VVIHHPPEVFLASKERFYSRNFAEMMGMR